MNRVKEYLKKRNKNNFISTNIPLDKQYPETYIYKSSESIDSLRKFNFNKKGGGA